MIPTGPHETSMVIVDEQACRRVASLLRTFEIPLDEEDFPPVGLNPRDVGNFYLLLVAICHQTSPVGKPPLEGRVAGVSLRGWDYLSARLAAAVQQDATILRPVHWTSLSTGEVRSLFRDPVLGERLIGPDRRAELIQDLGTRMTRNGWSHAQNLFDAARGRIASGVPNLTGLLGEFQAYSDPVRKKSFLFLAIMRNVGIWSYADEASLGSPVDYHEVRGHLRLGTVKVPDSELAEKLLKGAPTTAAEDLSIRSAVRAAIDEIANQMGSGVTPIVLHYLFWNVFRSCCTREAPHCQSCPPQCPLPARYVPLALHADGIRRCPFADVCESVNVRHRYTEHRFETEYY